MLKSRLLLTCAGVLVASAGCSSESAGSDGSAVAPAGCPTGDVVSTSGELTKRLAAAEPGDVIVVAAGTYDGTFRADRSGTADAPIVLCGDRESVLDAGNLAEGYVLHLEGAQHWRVEGLTLRNGAKGLVLDAASDNLIDGVTVEEIGEEGVHLRRNSSRNVVQGVSVAGTGLDRPDIGEGIYVGSAESNWCSLTGCEPDRSDDNLIADSTVRGATAEPIDVKEGTSGGTLRGNRLDGSGVTEADSLIDLKGNGWTVEGTNGTASPGNGVAVFEILDGWGRDNVLRDNRFEVQPDAWAVEVFGEARSNGNVVECSNVAVGEPDRTTPQGCRP